MLMNFAVIAFASTGAHQRAAPSLVPPPPPPHQPPPTSLQSLRAAAVCVLSIAPAVDTVLAWRAVSGQGAYKRARPLLVLPSLFFSVRFVGVLPPPHLTALLPLRIRFPIVASARRA